MSKPPEDWAAQLKNIKKTPMNLIISYPFQGKDSLITLKLKK
jgi:hypothetical protein